MDMPNDQWKARLRAALDSSGKSKRAVSIAAGLGEHWLAQTLAGSFDPGVEKLTRVCDELGVSLTYVMTGVSLTPRQQDLVARIEQLPEDEQAILAGLVRKFEGEDPTG